MSKRSLLPGLILALALAGCSDDNGGKGDGGTPPDKEAGTVWNDLGAPQGCEQKCLDEQPYYCVTSSTGDEKCVDCLEHKHCQGNPYAFGPGCDTSLNRCGCDSDAECQAFKAGNKCHETLGRCYCESDAECEEPLRCVGQYISTSICALPCKIDADCNEPDRSFCDVGSGRCVACSTTDHCKDSPDGTLCVDNRCACAADADCKGEQAWGNRCRIATTGTSRCGCDTDAECAGNTNGPTCRVIYHRCTCESDADCTRAPYTRCTEPFSYATYKHCDKPCATDADCADKGFAACDTASGRCVACQDDSHCTSSYSPVCDVAQKKCVACKDDSHCGGDKPFCDVPDSKCVECKSTADCQNNPDGILCDAGSCGCKVDAECKGAYPWGNRCIATHGRCGCNADADCSGSPNGPTCYGAVRKCTCTEDAQCTEAPYTRCAAPYASSSFSHCQRPCAADADCADKTGMKTCDTATGKCVACMKDGDCTSSIFTYCLGATGQCVQCRSDADCASQHAPACKVATGECVECKTDAHCAKSSDGKYCDVASNNCTCKTTADCAANQFAKVCDPTSGCEECKVDGDCGVSSLGNSCSGNICVCGADADCASRETGHICAASMQACSCNADSDCPAGRKCSGSYLGIPICQ